VRSGVVVLIFPNLKNRSCVIEIVEWVKIQALVTEAPVERFNQCVLGRLSWLDVLDLNSALRSPPLKEMAAELRTVINSDRSWKSASFRGGI